MSRRSAAIRQEVHPDSRFNDRQVARFINVLMKKGKRSVAEGIFYGALDLVKDKTGNDPFKVFKQAVENVRPVVEVKSRRVGGASYQVPVDVRHPRRISLAHRWLIQYARQRNGKSMMEKLAGEIMDAANKTGGAIRKKEDTHRMADANKAFAHYRW
jgi:small subunit ribosomal protein S7